MSRVYLVDGEGQVIPMESKPFENEDVIQDFLARCPELLPGEQVNANDPRRWLLVAREVGIPIEEGGGDNFSLDHLLLDQDGVPTLIEVKRATDTRIRREVVAQMLDYAANATTYLSVESMRSKMAACYGCSEDEVDEKVAAFVGDPDAVEAYWLSVKTNLQAARIRLVFAADSIPPTLRRMIEFLNSHLDPVEVLALEIKQFQNPDGRRTLVPNVIGWTSEAIDRKQPTAGARSTWDESRFFSTLAENDGERSVELGRSLLDWALRRGLAVKYGTGKVNGSLSMCVTVEGKRVPVALLWTGGEMQVAFYNLSGVAPFVELGERQELAGRFNALNGVSIPDDEDTLMSGAPTFPLADAVNEGSLEQLMSVLDWTVGRIQAQE